MCFRSKASTLETEVRDFASFNERVRYDAGIVFVQMFDAALASWYGAPSALCIFVVVVAHSSNVTVDTCYSRQVHSQRVHRTLTLYSQTELPGKKTSDGRRAVRLMCLHQVG